MNVDVQHWPELERGVIFYGPPGVSASESDITFSR